MVISDRAALMASKFCESGAYMVRMERQDWEALGRETGYKCGWLSLWARIQDYKEKNLIGKEIVVKEQEAIDDVAEVEPEKKQEGEDTWADDLVNLSEEGDS